MNAFEKKGLLTKKTFWLLRYHFSGCLGRWTFDEWQVQAPEIRGCRKGWFCDLEPTQTFRCLTAMFNLPFERQGTNWKSSSIFWCISNLVFLQALLFECNKMAADYLFQQDKHYDVSYDTGDKVIQCGRHNDIFKFWLMWRAKVISMNRFDWKDRKDSFQLDCNP